MKFLVLMAEEDTWNRWNALSDAEQQAAYDCFTAFTTAVEERGKVIAGDALDRPEQARTVRPGSERLVTEGPFAETVEQMGGFWVVELPDLETAVAAARLLPEAYSVEVRPIVRHRRLTGVPDRGSSVEDAWRDEWGRLLALLVARYRRLDLAEDGLGDAFEAAARTWPADGVPDNPAAWLLTAARRRILDRLRAEAVAARKLPLLAVEAELTEEAQRVMADAGSPGHGRESTSGCGSCCCARTRPLTPESAAALSLRLVMGVATEDIARLFLVPTPTMAARLTRARKRLARESFDLPTGADARAVAWRWPPTSPTWPSPPATRRARGPTCSGRTRRPRRSGWPGCCARSRPAPTSSSTRCSP